MSNYYTILLVAILQHTSSYLFRPTLTHHQGAHSCGMPSRIIILTSTISYWRRHCRLH